MTKPAMKPLVTGPAYWPTEEMTARKFWLYLASCRKFGVTPRFYGPRTDHYYGGAGMRIYGLLEFLKTLNGEYTHVLVSHLWDVLFTAPLAEIVAKYERFGSPPLLMGAAKQDISDLHPPESDRYNAMFDRSQTYWYPGWSMYMAEIPYIIDRFEQLPKGLHNDCVPFLDAFESKLLEPVYDHQCEIFHTVLDRVTELTTVHGRAYNRTTGRRPALVHFLLGPADPETGKDAEIIPWAKKLGIIE